MKNLCQIALDIQESADVYQILLIHTSVYKVLKEIVKEECKKNNELFTAHKVNTHPVNIVIVNRIVQLSGIGINPHSEKKVAESLLYCEKIVSVKSPAILISKEAILADFYQRG